MLARCWELVAASVGKLFVFGSWDVHDGRVVGGSGGFMVIDLNDYRLLTIFLVSAVAVLAATEIGRFLGVRAKSREGRSIATLESAILGLLALMIGFTFAVALSRFEARRDAVLNEANSIGTTALRARLLPAPHGAEAVKLLQEYVQMRLDATQHDAGGVEIAAAIARSDEIHEALWQSVMALAARDTGMVPTGLFIQTLNEMIDNHAKRLAALRGRVPSFVLMSLYVIAFVASLFAGYNDALEARHARLPVYATALLIAAVILLILDLDRPGAGFIEISQQPMVDAAASIANYTQ